MMNFERLNAQYVPLPPIRIRWWNAITSFPRGSQKPTEPKADSNYPYHSSIQVIADRQNWRLPRGNLARISKR